MTRKTCRDVRRVMYIRWRFKGSEDRWFWLARIISGRSQQVRTRRGDDKGSVAIWGVKKAHPVSAVFLNQVKLARAISRLCSRADGQSHLAGVAQIVGTSIRVGVRTINIEGG